MHSRHEKWLHDVQEQATCLRDEVTTMLNPPSEFLDGHGTLEPIRYIEVVELFEKKISLDETTSLRACEKIKKTPLLCHRNTHHKRYKQHTRTQ